VIQTKIRPPGERPGLVRRQRLLSLLSSAARSQLITVTGVAGVGKTTLVRQWLAELPPQTAVAWMTADTRDNDPTRFWRYVAASVRLACPSFTWDVHDSVTDEDLDRLLGELEPLGPLVLVLDDLQYLVRPVLLEQLEQVCEYLPASVQAVLVSRGRSLTRAARRSSSGVLSQVRGVDLLFTPQETEQVLDRGGSGRGDTGPTLERVARVHDATGGWPIAVALTAQLAPGPRVDEVMTYRLRRTMADYLTEELLRAQDEATQQFLLDTCVLDELSVSACNAVREQDDSGALLATLEENEALLTPLGTDGAAAWRHHAIVRDYLRRAVEADDPARWRELHLRAARFYADADADLGTAVDHALTAGDWSFAADLVARIGERTVGTLEVVRRLAWLEALPDGVIAERNRLRGFAVSLASFAHRLDLARRWVQARPPDRAADIDDLVAAAWTASQVGDLTTLGEVCSVALERTAPTSEFWFVFGLGRLVAENARGDWAASNATARMIRRPSSQTLPEFWGPQEYVWAQVVLTHARLGQLDSARAAAAELEDWLSQARLGGYEACGHRARAVAMLALLGGDVATAAQWVDLPNLVNLTGQEFISVETLLDMARVRHAAGDRDRATSALVHMRRLVVAMVDPVCYPQWLRAEEEAWGDAQAAPVVQPLVDPPDRLVDAGVVERLSAREVEVLRLLRSEYSLPEIANHLYVSYNTIKTHTLVIYRKLGVNGRSAAVGRARRLGYL